MSLLLGVREIEELGNDAGQDAGPTVIEKSLHFSMKKYKIILFVS